jgi:hypothetical protein
MLAIQTFIRHTCYMSKAQKLFENVIDQDVIDSLSNEQVDIILKMLEKI